ncbi:MAG TPA: hypothetical protein DCX60_00875, partial [Phycisphaerales bacterium]|nr:hypothetical protein [Phycisphaerales bacterium]
DLGGTYFGGVCAETSCENTDPIGACCVGSGCDLVTRTVCDNFGGLWIEGSSCTECPAGCEADLNSDGTVDGRDLAIILSNWGLPCR